MTAHQILEELKILGKASYKRTLMNNHGVKEPCFGVAISELQKIRMRIKKDHQLARELYDTGNYDAMYLAGLIANDARMTKEDLQHWAQRAYGGSLPGSTVPSVAAGSPHGHAMALYWIDSTDPLIASAGWATLSTLASVTPDDQLNLEELKALLNLTFPTHCAANQNDHHETSICLLPGSRIPCTALQLLLLHPFPSPLPGGDPARAGAEA